MSGPITRPLSGEYLKEQKYCTLERVSVDRLQDRFRVNVPKLQISRTGAWHDINMRLLSRAALWIGNMSGPNVSSNVVRLHAGWYGESRCPVGSREAPSDAERLRL